MRLRSLGNAPSGGTVKLTGSWTFSSTKHASGFMRCRHALASTCLMKTKSADFYLKRQARDRGRNDGYNYVISQKLQPHLFKPLNPFQRGGSIEEFKGWEEGFSETVKRHSEEIRHPPNLIRALPYESRHD